MLLLADGVEWASSDLNLNKNASVAATLSFGGKRHRAAHAAPIEETDTDTDEHETQEWCSGAKRRKVWSDNQKQFCQHFDADADDVTML